MRVGSVARKGREKRTGQRIVDVFERRFDDRGQVQPRAGNPPQLDNKVRICNRHNGGDDVCRWLLAQQLTQDRTRLPVPEMPEGAGCRGGHRGVQVPKQIDQNSDYRRVRRNTAAGLGPDCGLGVAQQRHPALSRQLRAEGCRSMDCFCQAWALHHIIAENTHQGGRGFTPTQGSERLHRSDLLRHRMGQSEPLEASAQRLQRGHRRYKAAAYNLHRYVAAVGEPDVGDGDNQCRIVELAGHETSRRFPVWCGESRGDPGSRKKIKLMAR